MVRRRRLRLSRAAPLAVVTALGIEAAPLVHRARARRLRRTGGLDLRAGKLGERPLLIAVTGDGGERARRGIVELLANERPATVFVAGVAGALSPGLALGDLVVARSVVGAGALRTPEQSPWLTRLLEHPRTIPGRVLSVDRIAVEKSVKASLLEGLGPGEPAVVDLETAAYVGRLDEAGVPWVVLRAVSDTAGEDLEIDFNRFRGGDGRVRPHRVLAHALLRPSRLRQLLELRSRVLRCAETLASALDEVVGPTNATTG